MSRQLSNNTSGTKDFHRMNPEDKILSRASSFRVPEGKSPETALNDLKNKISVLEAGKPAKKSNRTRSIVIGWSVAAGIIVLFGMWQIYSVSSKTRIKTGEGIHTDFTLADGSAIKLNACSKLSFNKRNFISDRQVDLNGEAYFEVTRGSSFVVNTPNGTVGVLGTSFNVFSRENNFRVACLSGKVSVTCDDQTLTLIKGESAELTDGRLRKTDNDKTKFITGWINGEFYFENTPLNLVFSEIERQFKVKFTGREIVNEFFTGSFVNKDLETALDIVCIPMGLEYIVNDNGKISISHKNR